MSGVFRKKRSPFYLELVSQGYVSGSQEYKKAYRKLYHLKNKERCNKKTLAHYHKNKSVPEFMERKRKSFRDFAKRQGSQWVRLRSKKYRVSTLKYLNSEKGKATRSKCYKDWSERNWEKRVEYARKYRRKVNPSVGLKRAISEARRTGNFRELAEACLSAIVLLDEQSSGRRNKSINSKRSL